jgi:cytochrome c biogenesis protein CcdA
MAMTILGTIAALAGETMDGLGGWVPYAVAVVPILMGLALLGGFRIRMPKQVTGWTQNGLPGAFLTGLLLSLVISPCGTPVLAAILSFAAYKGSPAFGALLLFAYGIGNGLPLLIVGTAAGEATRRLQRFGWTQWVNRGAGVAMLAGWGSTSLSRPPGASGCASPAP